MPKQIFPKGFCFDSVNLDGAKDYLMFSDHDDQAGERINQIPETALLKWIFTHPYKFKDYLFHEELDIGKQYMPHFEVRKPIIKDNSGPGDIDLLMIDPLQPQLSVGFQVKRLKGIISEDGEPHIKISNMDTGFKQTKYMFSKYRFHRNYLMVILVVDAQHRQSHGQMFRYIPLDYKLNVYEHSGFGDLPDEAGVYIFEVNQSSKNSINETANLSGQLVKKASAVDQQSSTTESIIAYLKQFKS